MRLPVGEELIEQSHQHKRGTGRSTVHPQSSCRWRWGALSLARRVGAGPELAAVSEQKRATHGEPAGLGMPRPFDGGHSLRMAWTGSRRAARIAGRRLALSPTSNKTDPATLMAEREIPR